MKIFVTLSQHSNVEDVFGFGVSPEIPLDAIELSESDGAIITKAECLGDYKVINGVLEIDSSAVGAKNLASTLSKKIAEIDAAYNAAIAVISASYPETERNSWAKQELEARAWTADNNSPTPLLTAISTARGTTIADICSRVITNADAYAVYAGATIGKRQAKMIEIEAATTIQELEAITW